MSVNCKIYSFLFLCFFALSSNAQDNPGEDSLWTIDLDLDITILPTRFQKDIPSFIQYLREDTTFRQSFKNLRTLKHNGHFSFVGKPKSKKSPDITYNAITLQLVKEDCRRMEFEKEEFDPLFFEDGIPANREYYFYTAKLLDKLFYTHYTTCETKGETNKEPEGYAKHIAELKKLMFNPGEHTNIPLIGKKTAIFEKPMSDFYEFKLVDTIYNGRKAFGFYAVVKPEYKGNYSKTVIQELITYFHRNTLQVLGKKYHLKHKRGLFDFDVTMDVYLNSIDGMYYPEGIYYRGDWHVATKKRERCDFDVKIVPLD